jgi:cell division septum initiation protein DivIVA
LPPTYEELRQENDLLKQEIDWLKRQLFGGGKSEKIDRDQALLALNEMEARSDHPREAGLILALVRWESLGRYIERGEAEIDNNLFENKIRPSAIGKKNWLFIGSPEAGERTAVI